MPRWSPHPLTLRQLQYVLAVADHASFRKAAEACAVAQPSLSAQVAQLEEALGVQLFERLPRAVLVTEAGEAILAQARRVLLAADDLVAAAETARDPLAATLRVGVIPTVAPYLLPDIAPVLRAKFPRLRLYWSEEKTRDLVRAIGAGSSTRGSSRSSRTSGSSSTSRSAATRSSSPCRRDTRSAAAGAPARLDQLEGETVLLLDDGHCFREQALSICRRAGAEEASVRATSLSTLAQMVAGGAGLTLLPSLAIAAENRARSLVLREFGPRGPARTLALAWRKTSPHEATLRAVAASVRGVVLELCARAS